MHSHLSSYSYQLTNKYYHRHWGGWQEDNPLPLVFKSLTDEHKKLITKKCATRPVKFPRID